MRIEALNQIAQIYNSNNTSKTKSTTGIHGRDAVEISQTGRDYQIAKQAVAETSDIREDKVAELKSQIESGEYSVNAGDFASKLLEKYNSLQ